MTQKNKVCRKRKCRKVEKWSVLCRLQNRADEALKKKLAGYSALEEALKQCEKDRDGFKDLNTKLIFETAGLRREVIDLKGKLDGVLEGAGKILTTLSGKELP